MTWGKVSDELHDDGFKPVEDAIREVASQVTAQTNVRIDGRGVSRIIAHVSDRIGADKAIPDECVNTAGDLTGSPSKEVAAVDHRTESRKQIALDYLALSRKEYEAAVLARIRFVLLARDYGCTNAEIGDALGIGESAVRSLTKRHAGGDAA